MLDTDLAWAAGFIDGEGNLSIGIVRKTGQLYAKIAVVNTDIRALYKLKEMFEGTIKTHQESTNVSQKSYSWIILSGKAANVAELIEPFLVIKKDQAKLLSVFQNTIMPGKFSAVHPKVYEFRAAIKQRLHELNKRGPRISAENSGA